MRLCEHERHIQHRTAACDCTASATNARHIATFGPLGGMLWPYRSPPPHAHCTHAPQVLTTRTYKEARQGAASGAAPTTTTLRIRFPEGVVLQGTFGGREPLTAVFEFVTSALRDPAACYELVTPSRRALPVTGLVREQGELLPSCLLNFRLLAEEGAGVGGAAAARRLPLLSDQMLRLARVDG